MIRFITTTEISYSIEKMLEDAKDYFFIVSPYIKIHYRLKKIIEEKIQERKGRFKIIVACRENDLRYKNLNELNWLQENTVRIYNSNNLHAKCYLTENEAVITSMNLYDYSQVNNVEFGCIISKDCDQYYKVLKEVLMLTSKEEIKKKTSAIVEMTDEEILRMAANF